MVEDDGKPKDEAVPQGKKVDTPVEKPKEDISELEKLKTHNDEIEKELVRGRELQAEAQKLEADSLMSGDAGGKVDEVVVDKDQEMADKLLAESE